MAKRSITNLDITGTSIYKGENTAGGISGVRHRHSSAIVALDSLEFSLPRRPFVC